MSNKINNFVIQFSNIIPRSLLCRSSFSKSNVHNAMWVRQKGHFYGSCERKELNKLKTIYVDEKTILSNTLLGWFMFNGHDPHAWLTYETSLWKHYFAISNIPYILQDNLNYNFMKITILARNTGPCMKPNELGKLKLKQSVIGFLIYC